MMWNTDGISSISTGHELDDTITSQRRTRVIFFKLEIFKLEILVNVFSEIQTKFKLKRFYG